MPWGRTFLGFTTETHSRVVHYLYAWHKEDRIYWDTQCGLAWGHRDNRDRALCPPVYKKAPTCLACIIYEQKIHEQTAHRKSL